MAMRTKIFGAALSLLMVGCCLAGTVVRAQVATTYSSNKRTLKVGILLLDSTTDADLDGVISPAEAARGPENPDPFIFYIADARVDLKPQNWEFINPLSPKTVTNDIANRWTARTGGNGPQYQVGQQVTKNMAAYWEVSLTDTPIQDLLQFDLLFLTNHRVTRLTAADREKLRKLVDAGGVLWLEDCGGMRMDPSGPLFMDQLQFSGGRGEATTGTPGPKVNVPNHPILNSPNPLSPQEIANLGDKDYSNYALTSINDATLPPNPETLVNVVGNTGRGDLPYIAAGTYGAGRVIATAGDSGCDINDYAGGVRTSSGGNSGAFCGENLITAHAEDLKFLYNVVSWGSANSQYRKDPRRTASSFESIGAPLISAFQVPGTELLQSTTAPLIAKGAVYVTGVVGGTATVRAYNAHPSLISGDVGLRDLALGTAYDEIWRWAGGSGMPSSPVLGTIFNSGASDTRLQYGDYIFVTLADGSLVRLTALAADPAGNILPAPGAASNAAVGGGGSYTTPTSAPMPAPAPVFSDGKVYVVEPNGLVRCVNASTMETLWYSFAAAPDNLYHPAGTPSLGFTRIAITVPQNNPDPNSQPSVGARSAGNSNDLMLYVPVWQENPSGGFTHRIMPYWLGARHEVSLIDQPVGSGVFKSRAAATQNQYVALNPGYPGAAPAGFPFIRPNVRVYTNTYAAGVLIYTAQDNMNAGRISPTFTGRFIDQTGFVQVQDSGGNPPSRSGPTPDNAIVSLDYDVYYVTPSATPPGLTGPNTDAARRANLLTAGFLGGAEGIAMTPDDILVSAVRHVNPSVMGATPVTTILGNYEQSNGGGSLTKLRQALGIFETPGGAAQQAIVVNNQPVIERPTLRNRLVFSGPLQEDLSTTATRPGGYEGLTSVTPVGAPVTTNEGTVYQVLHARSAFNGDVTVVAALDMKKEIVLRLPKSYDPAVPPIIRQMDMSAFDPSTPDTPRILMASVPQTAQVTNAIIGDPDRGRIIINDMRTGASNFSSSLSFVVTYTPAGSKQPEVVVLAPSAFLPNIGTGTDIDPREAGLPDNGNYSPLLWYYVLPGRPTSSLTLNGDLLYLGVAGAGATGMVVALDADPSSNDPSVRTGLGQQVETVVGNLDGNTQKLSHVRWVKRTEGQVVGAPVGSQGTLAVATLAGVDAYESGVTLVTDAKRIVEVDAGSSAIWTLDGTMRYLVAGGQVPFAGVGGVTTDGNGRVSVDRKPLSRPALARRLSPTDYLICDTGNNRVVRADRSGLVRWELTLLNDGFGVLNTSDPTTLNGPTDVQIYTTLSPANAGYEVHYLIADAGNNRIVEVADYFDRDGNIRTITTPNGPIRGEQVVVWVSRTTQREGRLLRFQSVQRILVTGDPRLGQDPTLYGYPTIVAAVGNSNTAGESSGDTRTDFTGGSVLSLEYYPINTVVPLFNAGGTPVTTYNLWSFGGNEPKRNGLVDRTMNELVMPVDAIAGTPAGRIRRIARPTYIQQISVPTGLGTQKSAFLICDSSGVYQAELGTDSRWYVTWYFDARDYRALMTGRLQGPSDLGFLPTAVKRLPSGDYLITNAWIGASQLFTAGQFVGEVFQVTGARRFDTTGAQLDAGVPLYAGFSAPNIALTRNTMGVVVRREQKMGTVNSNTNLLEHPLFGDRQ